MVTSSAVVGSSAISSFGRQASAIAIITRWRMPPEKRCGYSLQRARARRDAHALEDAQRLRLARPRRAGRGDSVSASAIWKPTVSTGLRLVIGSWKIIAISLPRTLRISSSRSASRSRPSSSDAALDRGRSPPRRSRMSDSAVTLLPEPDSPTIASVSRGSSSKERFFDDRRPAARPTRKRRRQVLRRRGRRAVIGSGLALQLGVDGVAQAVAEQVEREDRRAGSRGSARRASQALSRMFSKPSRIMPPQVGVGGLTPSPMKASEASVRIALASQSEPITRISAQDVGQDVAEHDARRPNSRARGRPRRTRAP